MATRWAGLRPPRHPCGFSLMEAVVAMSIVAFASSVLLLGIESTIESVDEQEEVTIADGLARQMLDEIQGQCWVDPLQSDPYPTELAPASDELVGPGRSRLDDNDDYHQYTANPPVDVGGHPLMTADPSGKTLPNSFQLPSSYLNRWRRTVRVAYVSESNHSQEVSSSTPTNYRAITCEIYRQNADNTWRLILQKQRILSYVPASH